MQDRDAWRSRVAQRERELEQTPGRYRLRLAALALLGYAVLVASLLLTLGVVVALLIRALIAPASVDPQIVIPLVMLGAVGAVILRALWMRWGEPPGHLLQPGEAPALQAEVERIRRHVGADRLHGIVIDGDLNAAAAHVPHGIGPWGQRQYLVLGLPLLQALGRQELAAVIAHEFGHFHGGHEGFARWIYGLRIRWYRLRDGMLGSGMSLGLLFGWFFRWYAPYFDGYSFVLARRHEYAADAMGADVAGNEAMGRALIRVGLASDWLEHGFWPDVRTSSLHQAHPPVQVHARMAEGLRALGSRHAVAPPWLLARTPDPHDTHPTLVQRLQALGLSPDLALDGEGHSPVADALLGDALVQSLEQRFSREWQVAAQDHWQQCYRDAEQARRRLAELEASSALSATEAVEFAVLVEDHRPNRDALPLLRDALARSPSHATGHCRLGAMLLKRGEDEAGIEHLQRAMALSPEIVEVALHCLQVHQRSLPVDSALHTPIMALQARYADQAAASVSPTAPATASDLSDHGLDAAQVQALTRAARGFDKVAVVWVVRRRSEGVSALPHYVVLVDWAGSVASETAGMPRLQAQITLPGSFTLLSTTARSPLARQMQQGAPLYRRR
jgi:Zn-dependent protease with chaperone function